MSYPPPFVVDPIPGHQHTHTVVLLHGRSSTAVEFATDLFSLHSSVPPQNLPSQFPEFRWVFLDAGKRWCTPFRERRSAWCDTFSLSDLSQRQDLQVVGLRDGIRYVKRTIEEEVNRLDGQSKKVVLGGFSQGSATALWALFTGAATTKGPLAAFIGLSAWMPFTSEAKTAVHARALGDSEVVRVENLRKEFLDILGVEPFICGEGREGLLNIPVYLGHGTDDVPVSVTNCHNLVAIFQALGVQVEAKEYVGADRDGHWVKEPEQVDDIARFLQERVVGQ